MADNNEYFCVVKLIPLPIYSLCNYYKIKAWKPGFSLLFEILIYRLFVVVYSEFMVINDHNFLGISTVNILDLSY